MPSSDNNNDTPTSCKPGHPSSREIFEASYSGAQSRPFIPRLRSDPPPYHPLPNNLVEFREQEGQSRREQRLREVWLRLPKRRNHDDADDEEIARKYPVRKDGVLTRESAKELEEMYEDELVGRCGGHTSGFRRRSIGWREFREYAAQKEAGMSLPLSRYIAVLITGLRQSCGGYSMMNWTSMVMVTLTLKSLRSRWIKQVKRHVCTMYDLPV